MNIGSGLSNFSGATEFISRGGLVEAKENVSIEKTGGGGFTAHAEYENRDITFQKGFDYAGENGNISIATGTPTDGPSGDWVGGNISFGDGTGTTKIAITGSGGTTITTNTDRAGEKSGSITFKDTLNYAGTAGEFGVYVKGTTNDIIKFEKDVLIDFSTGTLGATNIINADGNIEFDGDFIYYPSEEGNLNIDAGSNSDIIFNGGVLINFEGKTGKELITTRNTGRTIFRGTVTPTGSLNITGNADFDGATVKHGDLFSGPKFFATAVGFSGAETTIEVDAENATTDSTFKLFGFESFSGGEEFISESILNLKPHLRGGFYATETAVMCDIIDGNKNLSWKGTATKSDWNTSDTNRNWTPGNINTYFISGDSVVFNDNATNKTVNIADGVTVAMMTVSGTGYTFNLPTDGTPAVTALEDIIFGQGTNIINVDTDVPGKYTLMTAAGSFSGVDNLTVNLNGSTVPANLQAVLEIEGDALKLIITRKISSLTVETIPAKTYTGIAITPEPVVKDGDVTLIEDTDYTLSYKNNTNAGTATVTITGKGDYSGVRTADFEITKVQLTVTARPISMPYGTDPAVMNLDGAYDITGFVNNETEAVLTTKPKVSIDASVTSSSSVGNYPDAVLVSAAAAANYDFTYVNNTLTVIQAGTGNITFDPIAAKTYGDAPFNLSGRHTLDREITYESDNAIVTVVNTGQGWQATILGAGEVTLTARFAGDNDVAAESVEQPITISKAQLTVTARDQERMFTQPNQDVSSAYDMTGYINANDESLFVSLPTAVIDPQYDANTASGVYPGGVLVSGGEHPYYTLNYVSGILTISPAIGDIYFTATGNKTYGDAPFNLTATHVGGNTAKFESLNEDIIELYEEGGITKARILKVGTATLRAYTEAENSYLEAEDFQTITIGKASLTIRPHDKQRRIGEANPDFTLEFSGLQYDDGANTLGNITISTTADENSPAGAYPITASGASNDNYIISYNDGVLTILSDNFNIKEIDVDNAEYDNTLARYVMDCGTENIIVTVTTEDLKSVVIYKGVEMEGNTFIVNALVPGIHEIPYTVRSQSGKLKEYTIMVEKRFEFNDIIVQKWNNVLLVNNNPDNNGGYTFTSFKWFKNGEEIGTKSYYSAGDKKTDLLDASASYYVELTTEDGETLRTCEYTPALRSAGVSIYPVPVKSGEVIRVETRLPEEQLAKARLEVTGSSGSLMHQQQLTGEITDVRASFNAGTYLFKVSAEGFEETVKVMIAP